MRWAKVLPPGLWLISFLSLATKISLITADDTDTDILMTTEDDVVSQYMTSEPTVFAEVTTSAETKDSHHGHHHRRPSHHHEHHWGPFFEEPQIASSGQAINVSFHRDSDGELNCRVGMLRDKTVTWLRRMYDKVALLTVGETTYSADSRLSVRFQYPNNWKLLISRARADDAGLYMCQVSTHPPRVMITNVTVLPPALRIVDELGREAADRYYRSNSGVELTCQASLWDSVSGETRDSKRQQRLLAWSKDGVLISTNRTRLISSPNWLGLRLNLKRAQPRDSGTYTCQLTNTSTVAVRVHVLDEETQAAVHHETHIGKAPGLRENIYVFYIMYIIILNILLDL